MRPFTGLIALAFTIFVSATASADHHHKVWFEYLSGSWNYEITPLDIKGTVDYEIVVGGNALIGKFKGEDGSSAVELIGWDSQKKLMLINGYASSEDGHWRIELDEVDATHYAGKATGLLPNGNGYECTFEMKKIDENNCRWTEIGKASDGSKLHITGTWTRR